jgi:hypothetical protein
VLPEARGGERAQIGVWKVLSQVGRSIHGWVHGLISGRWRALRRGGCGRLTLRSARDRLPERRLRAFYSRQIASRSAAWRLVGYRRDVTATAQRRPAESTGAGRGERGLGKGMDRTEQGLGKSLARAW